jgi:hypothetical protein
MQVQDVIRHVREREYMDGIERDKSRTLATQEVFTPTAMVQSLLDQLNIDWSDPAQLYIDNACGDGQLLSEALIRKVEAGIDFETALSTIYGTDLMEDNVELCRERLLCGREDLRYIVEANILVANGLKYDMSFDGMPTDMDHADKILG